MFVTLFSLPLWNDTWIFAGKAVSRGCLNSAKWLLHRFPNKRVYKYIIIEAARREQIGILEMLKEFSYSMFMTRSDYATSACVIYGRIESMKWLVANGSKLYGDLIRAAVFKNSVEFVLWLLENNCPLPKFVCILHSEVEMLDILKKYPEIKILYDD